MCPAQELLSCIARWDTENALLIRVMYEKYRRSPSNDWYKSSSSSAEAEDEISNQICIG